LGQEEDRRRTREVGFDEHLVKPMRVQELLPVLSGQAAGSTSIVARKGGHVCKGTLTNRSWLAVV